MEYAFDMPDVQKWAEFSGDYNPIHFNLDDARLAGMDELILHGMLALMPVKQALSHALGQTLRSPTSHSGAHANSENLEIDPSNSDAVWTKFRALFRHPIPHGRSIALQHRPAHTGLNFKVCHVSSDDEHFRGSMASTESPADQYRAVEYEFHTALDAQAADKFYEFYPGVKHAWIALDAIVFADFMQSKLQILEDISEVKMYELHGPKKRNKVVVQLSHTVSFDANFFCDDQGQEIDWKAFSYSMSLPSMVASEHQLAGTVLLPVVYRNQLVMMIEIGLVSKFDPSN
ncbi:MAG: hypothetical protein E6Q34_06370 [Burkholderiaceae bacterium]|nr:MAG: hypothetical protein E6Q34_06370 [Burkholderiaceae bacterium]